MTDQLCPYCMDISTQLEPLLKVCSCTIVNPIHRHCLDYYRAVNNNALKHCPTCKDNYFIVQVGDKEQRKNNFYYKLRLFTEISLFIGAFVFSGVKLSHYIKYYDTYNGNPISLIFGSYYKTLSFSTIFSILGIYGLWFDRNTIITNLKELFRIICSGFQNIRLEETPQERTERNIREIKYELRGVVRELREQNKQKENIDIDIEKQNKQKKDIEQKKKDDKQYKQLSLLAKASTVIVVGSVVLFGSLGLFYTTIRGPMLISSYLQSRRNFYKIRNQSANLRVLAFNLESDRLLARNELNVDLPDSECV